MMNWPQTQMTMLDAAAGITGFGVNWFLQSTLLLAIGLIVGRLLKRRGSAAQSAVYRMTLVAVLVCPMATWMLSLAGISGWSVEMPQAWTYERIDSPSVVVPEPSMTEPASASHGAKLAFEPPIASNRLVAAERPFATEPPRIPGVVSGGIDVSPAAPAPSEEISVTVPVETWLFTISRFAVLATAEAVLWTMISTALIWRLATAWQQLARLRRQSTPAKPPTLQVCHELACKLAVPAPEFLRSPYLPSPCLAGIRRPAVLLPEVELSLSIRDVLIHELAHLARHDCFWNLLRRLATAVFFFQPLLWVLSRRLEMAAEEVCDDYVVHLGGDREAYAHRLVDIAELSAAPIAPAGVGIVSLRSMLARRVTRIMDTSRSLSTRVGRLVLTLVLVGGVVGTTTVGLIGLGQQSSVAEDRAPSGDQGPQRGPDVVIEPDLGTSNDRTEPVLTKEATATTDVEDRISAERVEYTGRVVAPDGKPVVGTSLYWVSYQIGQLPTAAIEPVAKSDAVGRFRFMGPRVAAKTAIDQFDLTTTRIVASADGFGLDWTSPQQLESGAARSSLKAVSSLLGGGNRTMRLVRDDVPIRGRIVNNNGEPVVGANVRVREVLRPNPAKRNADLTSWEEEAQRGNVFPKWGSRKPSMDALSAPQLSTILPTATTDQNGRFELWGVGRERLVELLLSAHGIETTVLRTRTRPGEKIVVKDQSMKETVFYGSEFLHVAAPSIPIEGQVTDIKTGKPLSGVVLYTAKVATDPLHSRWNKTHLTTITDENGRYRLSGLPAGKDNKVVAVYSGDEPYIWAGHRIDTSAAGESVRQDFKLTRGVWATGRVWDTATGEPMTDSKIHPNLEKFATDDEAAIWAVPDFETAIGGMSAVPVDGEGRFRLEGLVPGLKYSGWADGMRKRNGRMVSQVIGYVLENVSVKPGEEKHLGDIVVQHRD